MKLDSRSPHPRGEFGSSVAPDGAAIGSYCDAGFGSAYATLAERVSGLESASSLLPPRRQRSESESELARQNILAEIAARSLFLRTNLKQVYATLTTDLRMHLTISELCVRCAGTFPALLPSADQMTAERALPLHEREGRELSLASFVSAVLRDPECGRHLLTSMRQPSPRAVEQLSEYTRNGYLHLGSVTMQRRGAAAIITLENGSCLNAEDLELLTDLELAVDVALLSPDVNVGVIRGGVMTHPKYEGRRVFCAGINLRKLSLGQIPIVEYLLSREMGLIEKIRRGLSLEESSALPDMTHEKPWLGVVEGFAIGGGFQMLLNFDKVIASDEVYFSLPAAHEGIVPGSASFRLARHVGSKLARRMILLGEKIYAASPAGKLVCDEVVSPQDTEAAMDFSIDELASSAVVANRHMLNISDEPEAELLGYLAEFCMVQAERALSKDVMAKVKSW